MALAPLLLMIFGRKRKQHPSTASRQWLLMSLGCSCLACASDQRQVDNVGSFSQRDSAGVLISVTDGDAAFARLGWQTGQMADRRLGVTGDTTQLFHRISGVRQLASGEILVVDGGSRQLRFFDQDGTLISKAGRQGEGPGEFQDPALVPGLSHDSVLVWDTRLVRLHVYSQDGLSHRLIQPSSWAGGRPPIGIVRSASQALVEHSAAPLMTPRAPSIWEWTEVYSWIDLESGRRTTIDSARIRRDYRGASPRGVPIVFRIPFRSASSGVVQGTRAWLSDGEAAEIRVYDLSGRLQHLIRIDRARQPVTDRDLPRFIDAKTGGNVDSKEYWTTAYAEVPLPDSMATFESLLVDEVGLVWAERYRWDPTAPREWVVFHEDGRALGSVSTPARLDVHQVGVDFVLGVSKDSLGVEAVERYPLERATAIEAKSSTNEEVSK